MCAIIMTVPGACYRKSGLRRKMKAFRISLKNEKGATAVEYGLIVGLIAVVIIVGVTFVGGSVAQSFDRIRCELSGKNFATPTAAGNGWAPGDNYETDKHYDLFCKD